MDERQRERSDSLILFDKERPPTIHVKCVPAPQVNSSTPTKTKVHNNQDIHVTCVYKLTRLFFCNNVKRKPLKAMLSHKH